MYFKPLYKDPTAKPKHQGIDGLRIPSLPYEYYKIYSITIININPTADHVIYMKLQEYTNM